MREYHVGEDEVVNIKTTAGGELEVQAPSVSSPDRDAIDPRCHKDLAKVWLYEEYKDERFMRKSGQPILPGEPSKPDGIGISKDMVKRALEVCRSTYRKGILILVVFCVASK